jgi:glycerate 2-kinase
MLEPGPRSPREPFVAIQRAALAAADAAAAVQRSLVADAQGLVVGGRRIELAPDGRVFLIGLGKAAPNMARAAVSVLGRRLEAGLVTVPVGLAPPDLPGLTIIPAGHPLPDDGSLAAGSAAAAMLSQTGEEDLVLVLVSGGGSAMFELPHPGIRLADLRALHAAVLRSGAPIGVFNAIRRDLSQVKAGGLARLAAPARTVGLILSDVVGDRLSAIASGPTVLVRSDPKAALEGIFRFGLETRLPPRLLAALQQPPLQPPRAPRPCNFLVGSRRDVLTAAGRQAADMGFAARVLTGNMQGEARMVGTRLAARLRRAQPATCLLMAGETTVTVRGAGRGGRNQELAFAAAVALEGHPAAAIMALATDGIDGPTEAAGAIVDGATIAQARRLGFDPAACLEDNDTYPPLSRTGSLIRTGPTGTNLSDLVVGIRFPG